MPTYRAGWQRGICELSVARATEAKAFPTREKRGKEKGIALSDSLMFQKEQSASMVRTLRAENKGYKVAAHDSSHRLYK